jgi:hypothetical protein
MFVLLLFAITFLIIGVAIGKYKCYWLISGYNTASKEEKEKMNIETAGKYLAKMSYIVAILNLVGIFFVFFFEISVIIFVYLTIAIIFYFTWQVQKFDHSSSAKAGKIALVIAMVFVIAVNIPIFYTSYKSTTVEVAKDTLKIRGMYGRTIPRENIKEIELLDSIPKITMRTNGIGLKKVQKGNFKLEGISKGILFLEDDNGPYIQITTNVYTVFINYKDDAKTLEVFDKLDKEYKLK